MKQPEHQLQVACVKWFRYQYPHELIWATPNGGQRNAIVGAKMKAEGALAGVPDLTIPKPAHDYNGLFIEMKAGKNKPTPEQKEIMNKLTAYGYKCEVCYTLAGFIEVVNDYMK